MSKKFIILYCLVIVYMIVLNIIRRTEMIKTELEFQELLEVENNDQFYEEIDSLENEIIKVSDEITRLSNEAKI